MFTDPAAIQKKLAVVHAHLRKKEVKDALDATKELVHAQQNWQLSDKIAEMETNYRYMLHYFVEGHKGAEQQKIYTQLLRDIYTTADDAAENLLMQSSSAYFFDKTRTLNVRTHVSIGEYRHILTKQADTFSFIGLLDEGEEKESRLRQNVQQHENTMQDLFYAVFTLPRANGEQITELDEFIHDANLPTADKQMVLSAITMSLLQRFDAAKVEFLLDMCTLPRHELALRAIVGIIPVLQKYASRWHLHPECTNRLKLLSDDAVFNRRLMNAIIQFIQARETEKITKKLTEEILPEMMKLSPVIGRKINMDEWLGETEFDDKNPEWQKILDETGLTDKMQEFSELQMEGADVFHSTFSNLKSFPFFNEMSNWFLPFDTQHSHIQKLFSDENERTSLVQTMAESPFICNSDKYSFCFSMMMMPEQYRKMMISQLGAEGEEMKNLQKEEQMLQPHQKETNLSKQYIQDLYRFFKLYPRKTDFTDIFALPLNFHTVGALESVTLIPKNLERIALYYFEKNHFEQALDAYAKLAEISVLTGEVWQKIGYCRQMLADTEGALAAYRHADLLDDKNTWLLKRIAQCYRLLKQPDTALEYYRRAEQLHPDDVNIQLSIGHCYTELKKYDEALNNFFKVEMLHGDNARAWRSIAWCAFLSRKTDVARNYYGRILERKPNAHDYLNAAHVEICADNLKTAVELYMQSLAAAGNFDTFRTMLAEDETVLQEAGADMETLPFVLDKIRYGTE